MTVNWAHRAGRLPLLGRAMRRLASRYAEGSVVTIRTGRAAGLRWQRHHRYVNGYWVGHYELPIQEVFAREAPSGGTVFDAGANAGFLSLVASVCVGPSGRVLAIDPDPANQASIAAQIELNALAHVTPVAYAVGAQAGTASYQLAQPGSPQAHMVAPSADAAGVQVEVTTLDALAAEHGPPDFIKLDVEGAEVDALKGATTLLETHRPSWLIETHGYACAAGVRERLAAADYTFLSLAGRPLEGDLPSLGHVLAKPS